MMFTLDAAVKLPLVVRGQVSSRPAKKIRSIARVCSEVHVHAYLRFTTWASIHDKDRPGGSKMTTEALPIPLQPRADRPYPLRSPKMVQVALDRLRV
jgi:hypothetical protein